MSSIVHDLLNKITDGVIVNGAADEVAEAKETAIAVGTVAVVVEATVTTTMGGAAAGLLAVTSLVVNAGWTSLTVLATAVVQWAWPRTWLRT